MKNFIFFFLAFAGLQTAAYSQSTYKINTLAEGQELVQMQSMRSENGQFIFILQTDGNLCVYKNAANNGLTPVWCTMTNGKNVRRIQMQADGNLAAYSDSGHVWSTNTFQGTNDQKGGKLVLENDGSLILYSKTGKPIWKNGNKL